MILLSKFTVPIGWAVIFRRTGHQIYRGQCFGWAAALAYYSFLALFPALLLVVSIASFLPIQRLVDQVVEMVSRIAPGDVVAIVREQLLQITDKPHGRLLALSLVGTIWSMSSGMAALIGTLNQAQHISDGRSWWRIRAIAISLTGALTLFMAVSFTLAMTGPNAAQHLANWLNLGASFAVSWQIVRWPMAGLRSGEMVALEWTDIDFVTGQICVQRSAWKGQIAVPKGGRLRHVPMTRRLEKALRDARHLRGPRVLLSDVGGPLTETSVQALVRRAARKANLRNNGPHILRHTFCSHLAMRGAAPRAIQELAGHQDLSTTQRYLHLSPAAVEGAIQLLDQPAPLFAAGGETVGRRRFPIESTPAIRTS